MCRATGLARYPYSVSIQRLCSLITFYHPSIGGDGVRIVLAGKHCDKTASAAASVVVERTLATVSLTLLGLVGTFFAKTPYPLAVLLLGILLIVGITVSFILLTGWVPAFIRRRSGKIAGTWISFSESAGEECIDRTNERQYRNWSGLCCGSSWV